MIDTQPHWTPAYVGLGSNLDRPAVQIDTAFSMLAEIPDTRLVLRSSLYRSAPLGGIEQPDFANAAAGLLTQLEAGALLAELQQIERRRGRQRDGSRWGPRVINLDLLAFGRQVIDAPGARVVSGQVIGETIGSVTVTLLRVTLPVLVTSNV